MKPSASLHKLTILLSEVSKQTMLLVSQFITLSIQEACLRKYFLGFLTAGNLSITSLFDVCHYSHYIAAKGPINCFAKYHYYYPRVGKESKRSGSLGHTLYWTH